MSCPIQRAWRFVRDRLGLAPKPPRPTPDQQIAALMQLHQSKAENRSDKQ